MVPFSALWVAERAHRIIERRPAMPRITKLDLAWEAINSLGGAIHHPDPYERGFRDAIDKALDKIEAVGGRDPAQKRVIQTIQE